jgi:hypothetical protein
VPPGGSPRCCASTWPAAIRSRTRWRSPLALLIDRWRTTNNGADAPLSPAPLPVGLDLADVEEPAPEPPTRGGRR